MVKRRFLCSLLCCSPCCVVLALVGANAMFATFAPRILWFAHTIAAFAMGILSKTHQSSLTLKGGSTSFPKPLSPQGTGDVPTALLGAQTASL